jgi:serine/threonine protein kinase
MAPFGESGVPQPVDDSPADARTRPEDSDAGWPTGTVLGPTRVHTSVGRYQLRETIGQGSMGTVHRAFDPDLEREVAVKLVRGHSTENARARLLREARALARFGHPNIIQLYDVGIEAGLMYVVMEYRPGLDLKEWLGQEKRDWRAVLDVYLQAGQGLNAMHAVGIGHRDFKPQNVLLGEDGVARVLDFGLAKAFSMQRDPSETIDLDAMHDQPPTTDLTGKGVLLGTPAYMAAELWCGEPAEPRSDQFSLCVSLFEGLYGARPFEGEKIKEIGRNIIQGRANPPPPDAQVPESFWPVIRKGLEPQPQDRHASLYVLLRALERAKLRAEIEAEAQLAPP